MSEDTILAFMMQYPWLVTTLVILQVVSMVFKPLCDAAQRYVDSTVDTSDDEILVKVKASTAFRVLNYILDWTAGIKIPQRKVAVSVGEATAEKAA